MKHVGVGPIPVGTMVMVVGLQHNGNAVGTVVEGEGYRLVTGPSGKQETILAYVVSTPDDVKLTPQQIAACGGHYYKRQMGVKRKHLIPIEDPGDTEETFRATDHPRRRSRTSS